MSFGGRSTGCAGEGIGWARVQVNGVHLGHHREPGQRCLAGESLANPLEAWSDADSTGTLELHRGRNATGRPPALK
jgi:hypothetical protein